MNNPHPVHSDPDILGGTPVFVGTRVPATTLLEYLGHGDTLDDFLDHFLSVRKEQALDFINNLKDSIHTYPQQSNII